MGELRIKNEVYNNKNAGILINLKLNYFYVPEFTLSNNDNIRELYDNLFDLAGLTVLRFKTQLFLSV
jgi:hypothetical protein